MKAIKKQSIIIKVYVAFAQFLIIPNIKKLTRDLEHIENELKNGKWSDKLLRIKFSEKDLVCPPYRYYLSKVSENEKKSVKEFHLNLIIEGVNNQTIEIYFY
jgi:hypothetical protein